MPVSLKIPVKSEINTFTPSNNNNSRINNNNNRINNSNSSIDIDIDIDDDDDDDDDGKMEQETETNAFVILSGRFLQDCRRLGVVIQAWTVSHRNQSFLSNRD